MKKGYILALDFGTQSLRAIIFDSTGEMVEYEKTAYEPYFSVKPGYAEKDPEIYYSDMCDAVSKINKRNPDAVKSLKGCVVTALRDSFVNLDKNSNVLRPSILWLDQRKADGHPNIPKKVKAGLKVIKMTETMNILYRKSKSNWIQQHEPEIWNKTYKYLQISGYINHRLTGEFTDSTASQIGHAPFDYKKQDWMKQGNFKSTIFNVDIEKLPNLVHPGDLIGRVSNKASKETSLPQGLAVYAGGSDKGCETVGAGCFNDSCANISFGTTATIQTTSKKYYEPVRFLPPYPSVVPKSYNPEIQIFRGYWLISWFKKEFAKKECIEAKKLNVSPESILNQRLNEVPPGCRGLVLQPLWTPGVLMPRAKGAVIGFGDVHDRSHLYRSIIEGINFGLYDGLLKIEKKSGKKIKYITVSGGGSQSDAICQITADMMNRPVKRPANFEASALGAAAAGFYGAGVYKSIQEAADNMVHEGTVFYPDKKNAQIYNDLYSKVYVKIYPRLKELYKDIQTITNYPEI